MQVGRKDTGIFKDGAILDDGILGLGNLHHLLKPFVEEIDLEIERPTGHVGIKICQIGIIVYGFETWCPTITVGE
jgi:hypothetical protein